MKRLPSAAANSTISRTAPIDQPAAEQLDAEHAELAGLIARAEEKLASYEEDAEVKTAQIAKLSEYIGIASEQDALRARGQRDALWQAHREQLTAESADAFEASMSETDSIHDSQLAHARELGELRQLERDRIEDTTRSAKTKERIAKLKKKTDRIEARAENAATEIGLPKLPPSSLARWVKLRDQAAAAQRRMEQIKEEHRPALDRAEQLLDALRPIVQLANPTFETALAKARQLAEEERKYQSEMNAANEVRTGLEEQLNERRSVWPSWMRPPIAHLKAGFPRFMSYLGMQSSRKPSLRP